MISMQSLERLTIVGDLSPSTTEKTVETYIYIYVAFQCSPQEINALAMVTDKMLGKTWRKIMYQLNILWPTNEYMLECSNIEKKIGNIVWLKKKFELR